MQTSVEKINVNVGFYVICTVPGIGSLQNRSTVQLLRQNENPSQFSSVHLLVLFNHRTDKEPSRLFFFYFSSSATISIQNEQLLILDGKMTIFQNIL